MGLIQISQKVVAKVQKLSIYQLLAVLILSSAVFFIGSSILTAVMHEEGSVIEIQTTRSKECETHCILDGSETLPKGIVAHTSNLEMSPPFGSQSEEKPKRPMNLLAIAAGIKQTENVNKIIKKFPASEFALMLFHYDGIVGKWKNFEWSTRAIHVSAINQTKWWFAKRFLHPDIVSDYSYIFLWDEDLGVDNFDPKRYLSIVQKEGLEISQPALDPRNSVVHHPNTAREHKSTVHRFFSAKFVDSKRIASVGSRFCAADNTKPPCAGFVEMMAPVFSRASWRCVWHMVQIMNTGISCLFRNNNTYGWWTGVKWNDLIIGWGLDIRFGYCAQGDRIQNVGIVDAEYISHKGTRTLGSSEAANKLMKRGFSEADTYERRWSRASEEDKCWIDPYERQSYTILYQ